MPYAISSTLSDSFNMTKKYNGEKTDSSINGAGKTGQLLVKEGS